MAKTLLLLRHGKSDWHEGETDFDRAELAEIESALHLTQTAGVLSYLYKVGDAGGFARTRQLLLHLLS